MSKQTDCSTCMPSIFWWITSHNITKSSINTKTAQWMNSYFINCASHKHSNYIFVKKAVFFLIKSGMGFEIWTLKFLRADGKPQILLWILMGEKGTDLVYFYVKLSILSIGGARMIFINTSKCHLIPTIKKWSIVLSSLSTWRSSFTKYKRF